MWWLATRFSSCEVLFVNSAVRYLIKTPRKMQIVLSKRRHNHRFSTIKRWEIKIVICYANQRCSFVLVHCVFTLTRSSAVLSFKFPPKKIQFNEIVQMNTTRCNIEYFKVRFGLKQTVNNRPNRRHAATAHSAIFGADPHLFSWKKTFLLGHS